MGGNQIKGVRARWNSDVGEIGHHTPGDVAAGEELIWETRDFTVECNSTSR